VGPDQQLYPYTPDLTLLANRAAARIRQLGVDAVITHGSNGEYGHPAHVLTHRAARIAVASLGQAGLLLYTVSATFSGHPRLRIANPDDPAHLVLDITPALVKRPRQLATVLSTPPSDSVRRKPGASSACRRSSAWRAWTGSHCNDTMDDELAALLKIKVNSE
jgi:LmbE family N-acetylglucosaminyl deacetylase